MEMFIVRAIMFITLSTSTLLFFPCQADNNELLGFTCSSGSDDSTADSDEFQANLKDLLTSLAANGPANNGFYTTKAGGKGHNRIYGLAQCRGDIAATDCANCIRNSSSMTNGCPASAKSATIWFKWCVIRYSNVSFFGTWDQAGIAVYNSSNLDDPRVFQDAVNMMNQLAYSVPQQPNSMFQTEVIDVGESGKRYGMGQCTSDISRTDCGKCLNFQLNNYMTSVGNKRWWVIYGSSCSLWYYDYKFYFNYSISASAAASDLQGIKIFPRMGKSMLVMLFLLVLQP
ncbi:hypothetical protein Tsubulata_027350 [Turnera subulata]|uniref:Gnk2-homologous domain-containing protein n=1 Tax=Turnera subulata TaxID=218843 RepID=A0A9Q0FZE0_9ROSI|nr:hypothetical protein Tsubulata_027350 [Turnera subulata]